MKYVWTVVHKRPVNTAEMRRETDNVFYIYTQL